MLGWEHTPPQDTLEREIAALKARAVAPVQPSAAPALDVEKIKRRLHKRRTPAMGKCASCGHRQQMMPSWQPLASSMAIEQWKCRACGGQISIMVNIGGNAPSADEDIQSLLAEVARLRALQETEK